MKLWKVFLIVFFVLCLLEPCFAFTDEEIQKMQASLTDRPIGERIVFWAERFIGTPYDPDPTGAYVTQAAIVADERVDCMYLTFRVVELAFSRTPGQAIEIALEKRFHSKGVLKNGQVLNYEDRFEYGEDMIESGKWGKEVTPKIGKVTRIKGARGKEAVEILSVGALLSGLEKLRSGDIIFFATKPEKRSVGEIIGHIGFIKEESPNRSGSRDVSLIHAGGAKRKGGEVRKVLLKDYVSKMGFIGVKITRFH